MKPLAITLRLLPVTLCVLWALIVGAALCFGQQREGPERRVLGGAVCQATQMDEVITQLKEINRKLNLLVPSPRPAVLPNGQLRTGPAKEFYSYPVPQ